MKGEEGRNWEGNFGRMENMSGTAEDNFLGHVKFYGIFL